MASAGSDMIPKLEQVRQACLADASQYLSVVPGVVPIVHGAQAVDVRRWGADFLAEAFATPGLRDHQKEQMLSEDLMTLLRGRLENPAEDSAVVRSTIQTCASIYPHVFRKIISHPELAQIWNAMRDIKLNILQRMDPSPLSVRVCCIKFLQKVVQVQTPGQIADPRRPDQNETSLALVGRNHPLLIPANLEAEASGMLDRLLSILQENAIEPLMVDPSMNCLAVLIKTRPAVQAKIVQAILNFNPLTVASQPLNTRTTIVMKSLMRTTRALLRWVMRTLQNNPQNGPLLEKVDTYLRRLQSQTTAVLSQAQSLKRAASIDAGDAGAKRQKIEGPKFAPMPNPPISYAQLFTLIDNPEFQQFDVKILPEEMVRLIAGSLMQHIDSRSLDEAVEEVQMRLQRLQELDAAALAMADDDDEYDPEALAASANDGGLSANKELVAPPTLELGAFELPKPPPLTDAEIALLTEESIAHVFEVAMSATPASAVLRQKSGINRLAGNANDRDSWLTIMIRLATRAPASLDTVADVNGIELKDDVSVRAKLEVVKRAVNVPDRIRQHLFDYILDDWKHRLSLAITWLTEEWYADRVETVAMENGNTPMTKADDRALKYTEWTTRLFERLIPRFDKDDHKHLIRFLSELPALNANILSLLKSLTKDPATVDICKKAMQYLYLMRPPVRDDVVELAESVWQEADEDVKASMTPLLKKWKPTLFVETVIQEDPGTTKSLLGDESRTFPNGVKAEDAASKL